jgi:hypothetical protein
MEYNDQTLVNNVLLGNTFDYVILKHLNMRDVRNLGFTNWKFRSKFNLIYIVKEIKNRIKNMLKFKLGSLYDEFVDTMIKTDAIISGSFILQCVLNEFWDSSDIDIYVENNSETKMENEYANLELFNRLLNSKSYNTFSSKYPGFDDFNFIEEIMNYDIYIPTVGGTQRLQVINVNVSGDYTMRDHKKNTGFDICKNVLSFNNDRSMNLEFTNLSEIIYKCTTFSILDLDDFLYRLEKYSNRGFKFKPKHNKLLFLEYILIKLTQEEGPPTTLSLNFKPHIYKKNIINNNGIKGCSKECPIGLLYRDVMHYHETVSRNMNSHDEYNIITVDNKGGEFSNILPQLICNSNSIDNLKKAKYEVENIWCPDNSDKWVTRRTHTSKKYKGGFVKRVNEKWAIDTSNYKYDIQFGLSCNRKIESYKMVDKKISFSQMVSK